MQANEGMKMPALPKWDQSINIGNGLFMILVIVAVVAGIKLLKKCNRDAGDGAGGKGPIVNFNPRHRLPEERDVSLLIPGDTVTVESPVNPGSVRAQVTEAEGFSLSLTLPAGCDLPLTCPAGNLVQVTLDIGGAPYPVPAQVTGYRPGRHAVMNLRLRETVTRDSLSGAPETSGEIPALFAVVPGSCVMGDCLPFSDLCGHVSAEIPGVVTGLRGTGAVLRTRSPLPFREGDLVLLHFKLPDDSATVDIWGGLAACAETPDFQGMSLRVNFLTHDELLDRYLSADMFNASVGLPATE